MVPLSSILGLDMSPINESVVIFQTHKCHYGACPPCRLICEEAYSCGHSCKLRFASIYYESLYKLPWVVLYLISLSFATYRCHGPRPPPLPEFTLKPKRKKSNYPSEPTPGTSCPPCPELVWRSCLGDHIGAERMVCVKCLVS